jgi:type IV pilus assembly protein PilW
MHCPEQPQSAESGFTLIELMIGLTIGMLVALVALGSFLFVLQGSTTVSEGYRLAATGNTALRRIADIVRQAGAAELVQPGGTFAPVSFGDFTRRAVGGTQLVSGTEGAANAPDTLTVSFEHRGDNITRDCLGNAPGAAQQRVDNFFSVSGVELRCLGRLGDAAATIIGGVPAVGLPLVGDNSAAATQIAVEDFQVWYWLADTANARNTRRYSAWATPQSAPPGGWAAVQAVEICLQLRGTSTNNPAGNFTNCQGNAVANNGQLHQVFRGVYALRNRI